MKTIKAWLVRSKSGKAKSGIFFWRTLAKVKWLQDYQEIVPIEITIKILKKPTKSHSY